jgi:hypothetical protein
MGKIMNWKAPEVFNEINDICFENANKFMDLVKMEAQRRCPVDPDTFREGKFANAAVSFTPRTGKNKGKLVQFKTSRRWLGRSPGNLRDTIRRVNKVASGNIRVYAGNYKIYWAFMVERGFHDRKGRYHPGRYFLRNSFASGRVEVLRAIKYGV